MRSTAIIESELSPSSRARSLLAIILLIRDRVAVATSVVATIAVATAGGIAIRGPCPVRTVVRRAIFRRSTASATFGAVNRLRRDDATYYDVRYCRNVVLATCKRTPPRLRRLLTRRNATRRRPSPAQ